MQVSSMFVTSFLYLDERLTQLVPQRGRCGDAPRGSRPLGDRHVSSWIAAAQS
ncbi:hypothetical protein [Scytonema sp. HK-05]|uniref:hypothetical protein n=1 Tax=Scytonema sp. HK-05 TaxID=1137095 RepID=UPI0018E95FEF|nr:hypothetical protein [Scytonema sp. HK-05]